MHAFLSSAEFFFFLKINFLFFRYTIKVAKCLDPDQARQNVGPELGPNCLRSYSADETSRQRVTGLKYSSGRARLKNSNPVSAVSFIT